MIITQFCLLIKDKLISIYIVSLKLEAIRRGLLKVIPQAVLDLLTWQELERKVCGDPEITIEELRRSSKLLYNIQ